MLKCHRPTTISIARRMILPALFATIGCSGGSAPSAPPGDLLQDRAFVSVARGASTSGAISMQSIPDANGNTSFYLAIHKTELDQRFFLSTFISQLAPGGVSSGAGLPLPTRVVTFRVQNGKLYIFDAQDGHASSDTFDPSLIIEAYPLVDAYSPFLDLPGHDDYVLFDPTAGLNRFDLVSNEIVTGGPPLDVHIDLTYMQNFRAIADGATFEQVFSGTSENAQSGDNRTSGTLALSLRRYSEGQGFQPFDADSVSKEYYFRADPLITKNTGGSVSHALKWNIHPGMKPIRWVISDRFVDFDREHPGFGMTDAMRAGVESWNAVFGFQVVETVIGSDANAYGDDDVNYVLYDEDPSLGASFGVARNNPNTGEIRGASVYFSSAIPLSFLPVASASPAASVSTAIHPMLSWGGMRPNIFCAMDVPALGQMTDAQNYIESIAAHEIGHTLGLRHNFKGSLLPYPQESSVMDYLQDFDITAGHRETPGPYDADAVRLLYGLSSVEPAEPFCTDEDTFLDPNCARYDSGEHPLMEVWAPSYQYGNHFAAYFQGASPSFTTHFLNDVAGFLRAGSGDEPAQAWSALSQPFALGIDRSASEAKYPGYTARMSELQNVVLRRLYLDAPSLRGRIRNDPALTGAVLIEAVNDLRDTLINIDTYRGWNTRRTAVDVLKKMQVLPAYEALRAARLRIAADSAGLASDSEDAALAADLLARIDAAVKPYFAQ